MGLLADVFGADAFNLVNMTDAVIKLPQQPSKIGDMGLFTPKPIATVTATVESRDGVLTMVQSAQRGTRANEMPHAKSKIRAFPVYHYPLYDSVKADEIVGVREFSGGPNLDNPGSMESGEAQLRVISTILNDRLQIMKNSIDITKEWHRANAIQGTVLDADGTTMYNLFTEFGISQTGVTFDFSATPSNDVKVIAQQLCRKMIFALGNTAYTGIQIICGDAFWDAFIQSVSVKEAYKNYASNTMLQTQQRNGFMFADCFWTNYTARFNSTDFIPTNNAYAIPIGVPNLFAEVNSPAPFIESVNTPGKPYYSKQRVLEFETGIELHMQSNWLMMCNRPGVLMLCQKS